MDVFLFFLTSVASLVSYVTEDSCPERRTTVSANKTYHECNFANMRDVGSASVFYVRTGGFVSVVMCIFNDCAAQEAAGVIFLDGGRADMIECTFDKCKSVRGGVAQVYTIKSWLCFESSSFSDCHATEGGVIYMSCSNSEFVCCDISNCHSTANAGVVSQYLYVGSFGLKNCSVQECHSEYNGGVCSIDTIPVVITFTTFLYCRTGRYGGVLFMQDGSINMSHCSVIGCSSAASAGALEFQACDPVLRDCNFSHCYTYAYGSAVYVPDWPGQQYELVIENCRMENCSVSSRQQTSGGAVCTMSRWPPTRILNCSFIACRSEGTAAAIMMRYSSSNTSPLFLGVIENCEMVDCVSKYPGAAIMFSYVLGTLIAKNIVCQDCYSQSGSAGLAIHVNAEIFRWENLCLALAGSVDDSVLVYSNVDQPSVSDLKHGTSGVCPVPTQAFSASCEFTVSNTFAPSESFSNSKKFTESQHFTKSDKFTRSDTFTKSSKFTPTDKFTASETLTMSSDFTLSLVFTDSAVYNGMSGDTFDGNENVYMWILCPVLVALVGLVLFYIFSPKLREVPRKCCGILYQTDDSETLDELDQQNDASWQSNDKHENSNGICAWVDLNEKYRLLREIGRGSYATVYAYQNKQDGSLIAVKNINVENWSEHLQCVFERELRALTVCASPCVLPMRGFMLPSPATGNSFVLVLEYMKNGSLLAVIKNKPRWFDNTAKVVIIAGIAHAMKIVHANGFIHRDLKPENILIDDEYHPRVSDFGSARVLDNSTMTNTGIGFTPMYRAPDAYEDDYDHKVDVYSFGIVLYEIVTGDLLRESFFKENVNPVGIFLKITKGNRPSIPENITPFAKNLIEQCWSSDRNTRPEFSAIYDAIRFRYLELLPNIRQKQIEKFFGVLDSSQKCFNNINS